MRLPDIQLQWIGLWDELNEEFGRPLLAAPFVSVPEDPSSLGLDKPILLVGKATAGDWLRDRFVSMKGRSMSQRLEERRRASLGHLLWRRTEDRRPSDFWRFRRDLEKISRPAVWTNIAKIGTERSNPGRQLVERQSRLAQETLGAEILEYKPALVVLVTSDFADQEIALPLFGPEGSWSKSRDKLIWWKERTKTEPPILWVDHPGRKSKQEIERWLRKAMELSR